jgi:hypothetical protein
MFARVATFEGDQAEIRRMAEGVREDASGPPEGVPGKELLILTDRDAGKSLVIVFFETENDLRQGNATLNEMSPPPEAGSVKRTDVGLFDVAVHRKV